MKNVKFSETENIIDVKSLLKQTNKVLIGFKYMGTPAIFIQEKYDRHNPCKNRKYLAKDVKNLGFGNGWISESRLLEEWISYFQKNKDDDFEMFVFEDEKEMYQWMLEMCQRVLDQP